MSYAIAAFSPFDIRLSVCLISKQNRDRKSIYYQRLVVR